MARPKSDVRRRAILEAATRVIVAEGLGASRVSTAGMRGSGAGLVASTAGIAKEAGIPNGSLFTYFETKGVLFNELYLELRRELAMAGMEGLREDDGLSEQLFHVWNNWMEWGKLFPEKRRAMEQLEVSEEITSETRRAAHSAMAGVAEVVDRVRRGGPLSKAPLRFVVGIMNSTAETTMDFMARDPGDAWNYCMAGFEAVWRMLGRTRD